MGRRLSRVLVWGAAGGLLLTAILPTLSSVDPQAGGSRLHSPVRDSAAQAASSDDRVSVQDGQAPDLMHRKHQEDGPVERGWLRPSADAGTAQPTDPREMPDALAFSGGSPLAGGRNAPLRL
jgi:hypothetical protein